MKYIWEAYLLETEGKKWMEGLFATGIPDSDIRQLNEGIIYVLIELRRNFYTLVTT